jgi:broad specificity phosphatase PhoE
MTHFIVVRHGETTWNSESRYQGQTDVPLSARGWLEAECLAERFVREPIAAIYSSDLSRAADTARVIARRLGVSVVLESRLREANLGEWQGVSYSEVRRRFFGATDPLPCYAVNQPPRGGESLRQLQARLFQAVGEIAARHANSDVLLVLHGGCLRALFCAWLRVELTDYWKLQFDSASVSEVVVSRENAVVTRLNDCAHLAPAKGRV